MSDIITITGKKLSEGKTKTLDELRNDSRSGKTFIPGIISGEDNVKIPIDSFVSDSWKAWSEEHGSSSEDGFENSYYIGSGNHVRNGFAIGDNNTSSGGVNIGYNNYIETDAGATENPAAFGNFNIGKYNSACYDDNGNIRTEWKGAVNIGQRNKAGMWGVNLGEDNFAHGGSYNIGTHCSATRGSFTFGNNNSADGGSVMIGFNNSAKGGSYAIGENNKLPDGGVFAIGRNNNADPGSYIFGEKNEVHYAGIVIGHQHLVQGRSIVVGNTNPNAKGSTADAGSIIISQDPAYADNGSLVLLGNNTNAYAGSIAIGGTTSATEGSVSIGDNGNNNKNLVANGSYNIGQGNSAKGGVFVIGNNNNANYEEKKDAHGQTISPYTNTTILGDNNYTENYIGKYSAIDYYSYMVYEDGVGHTITGYSAKFTGIPRSFIVGNSNSAIGWNQYSFGEKNFNGSTIYTYDPETSSYNTSGLEWRNGKNSYTKFKDDLGYTFTFGRGNSAVRMFDMAIGLSSFASGGQNIAIGYGSATVGGMNVTSKPFNTTIKEGSRNIAYNSYLQGGYDNVLLQSYFDLGTSGFVPTAQTRNHLVYSVVENTITGFTGASGRRRLSAIWCACSSTEADPLSPIRYAAGA